MKKLSRYTTFEDLKDSQSQLQSSKSEANKASELDAFIKTLKDSLVNKGGQSDQSLKSAPSGR